MIPPHSLASLLNWPRQPRHESRLHRAIRVARIVALRSERDEQLLFYAYAGGVFLSTRFSEFGRSEQIVGDNRKVLLVTPQPASLIT
jgi:hypothetical protein